MNLFETLMTNWSRYELEMIILTTFLLFAIQFILSLLLHVEKRLVLISAISSITAMLLSSLVMYLSNWIFAVDLTEKFSFILLWTMSINMMNLVTLNSFFLKKRKSKDFDEDIINREHFSDTLKLLSFMCLFFSVLIAFTSGELQTILLLSGISSVLVLSLNHVLARIFFKDKKSEK